MNSKDILNRYIKSRYGKELDAKDFENKNNCFDIIFSDRNMNITVEYKTRYFETGKNDYYLKQDDILIELIQSTPYIKEKQFVEYTPHAINVAVGWFYKCYADRLIYIRLLDNNYYDLVDIEFKSFKSWLFNNIDKYKLQYSSKTTGTINLMLPLIDIPKPIMNWEKKHE